MERARRPLIMLSPHDIQLLTPADDVAEVPGESGVRLQLPRGFQSPVAPGGKCLLACRPEDVYVEPPGDPGLNRLSATVETIAYLGEHIEYGVRTAGGQLLGTVLARLRNWA